jgi:ABC-2 type transport system permease protein
MAIQLLHYRPWHGALRSGIRSVWPIARVAVGAILRRRLFWVLYSFGLLLFLMFFFGSFLLDWVEGQVSGGAVQIAGVDSSRLSTSLRRIIRILNGSQDTFAYFFIYQGGMVMIVLAFTGSLLVGGDFVQRSVGFYLAKPIHRWHYILGKCLATGIIVNLLTTLPALLLFGQNVMGDWDYLVNPDYFRENNLGPGPASWQLLLGILGFGLVLTVFLSIILVAVAAWMRRTMPIIMAWTSLFMFLRLLVQVLVDRLQYPAAWRLLDLWNSACLLGFACLGYDVQHIKPEPQPPYWQCGLTLLGVCIVCLIYLDRRMRSVEIVS